MAVLIQRECSPPRLVSELTESAAGGFRLVQASLLTDWTVGGEDGCEVRWQGWRCFTLHPLSHPLWGPSSAVPSGRSGRSGRGAWVCPRREGIKDRGNYAVDACSGWDLDRRTETYKVSAMRNRLCVTTEYTGQGMKSMQALASETWAYEVVNYSKIQTCTQPQVGFSCYEDVCPGEAGKHYLLSTGAQPCLKHRVLGHRIASNTVSFTGLPEPSG